MRRFLALLVAVTLHASAARAQEQSAAELAARGEELAKERRFADAIEQFKRAHALEARRALMCHISLSYRRLERWGQAEYFASLCMDGATEADALPTWSATLRQEVATGLENAKGAWITVDVQPVSAGATVTISSFAPDETMPPRRVFLAPGTHLISAQSGGVHAEETVEVSDGEDRTVVVKLTEPEPSEPSEASAPESAPEPVAKSEPAPEAASTTTIEGRARGSSSPGIVPIVVTAAAGLAVAGGVVFHALATGERGYLDDSPEAYDEHIKAFRRDRAIAVAGYAAGALLGGAAVYLWTRDRDTESRLVWSPTDGGAVIGLSWER